jgi:hypothetical protein
MNLENYTNRCVEYKACLFRLTYLQVVMEWRMYHNASMALVAARLRVCFSIASRITPAVTLHPSMASSCTGWNTSTVALLSICSSTTLLRFGCKATYTSGPPPPSYGAESETNKHLQLCRQFGDFTHACVKCQHEIDE